jgi:D-beta-D-heptose 7-phosphate kinase/D-beta-D-heptose 1-phosphate adenosyltransferase
VDTAGVVSDRAAGTIVKTRIMAERQQVVRVDHERPPERARGAVARLAARLPALVQKADGVVIEDYGKGVITQAVVDAALAAARARRAPVGLDPKENHALAFSHLTLATPNYAEACSAAGLAPTPLGGDLARHATLRRAGEALLARWRCELLMITLGAHGMYLARPGHAPRVIPTRAREVFDVCGAGDTVIATTMLGLAAGANPYEAAALANYAAGVVVGKIGTATCTRDELLAYMRQRIED